MYTRRIFGLLAAIVFVVLAPGCEQTKQDPNTVVGYDGLTPVHRAAMADDTVELERLLSIEYADPNVKDIAGVTPLHYAAREGHLNVVKMLISYGALPALATSTGWTAVDLAVRERHVDVIHFLSQYGFNPQGKTPEGEPYLVYAVRMNDTKLAEYLLRERVNPNAYSVPSTGESLLEYAFSQQNRPMIQLLLNHGARLEHINKSPKPPLHQAIEWSDAALVSRLLTAGADPKQRDRYGRTAAECAEDAGLADVAELIHHYESLAAQG